MIKKLVFILICLLSFLSCSKDDEPREKILWGYWTQTEGDKIYIAEFTSSQQFQLFVYNGNSSILDSVKDPDYWIIGSGIAIGSYFMDNQDSVKIFSHYDLNTNSYNILYSGYLKNNILHLEIDDRIFNLQKYNPKQGYQCNQLSSY